MVWNRNCQFVRIGTNRTNVGFSGGDSRRGTGRSGTGHEPDGVSGTVDGGRKIDGSGRDHGGIIPDAVTAFGRLFPSTRQDGELAQELSGNICANVLGLGNAATPMGIRAVKRMAKIPGVATDEMCRLIVLNTASIQLIPANVAAVRASLGAAAPFDILPAVWLASICSAGLGITAAWLLGKVWGRD